MRDEALDSRRKTTMIILAAGNEWINYYKYLMNEMPNGQGTYFWKVHSLVGSSKNLVDTLARPRICRFCKKDEHHTSFNQKAHAVPELLGANDFIIHDECDQCNSSFSAYESHLSKFFLPYLSSVQVRGKTRVPAFHSRTEPSGEDSRTILQAGKEKKLQLIVGLREDVHFDYENKLMSVRFRLPPHRPLLVYKALVKIGLSIMPAELTAQYRSVFDWLMGEESKCAYFPMVFVTSILNQQFAYPSAELYQANWIFDEKGFNPEMTLIVKFANLVVQIFMPLTDTFDYERSQGLSPQLEVYPASVIYNMDQQALKKLKPTDPVTIKYKFTRIDLSSESSVNSDEIINFSFKGIDRQTSETDL